MQFVHSLRRSREVETCSRIDVLQKVVFDGHLCICLYEYNFVRFLHTNHQV